MALLSRFIANQRYSKIEPYIRGNLLDLGCNNAQILQKHRYRITHYVGIERSPGHVAALSNKYPEAHFIQRDLDCDRLELDKKFDCILMIALIEHLFNQKFIMEEVSQSLTPGGIVVITTPTPLGNDIVHRLGSYLGLFAKSAIDDHIIIYNRHRFKILAREVNLRVKKHIYFQMYCNQLTILEKP